MVAGNINPKTLRMQTTDFEEESPKPPKIPKLSINDGEYENEDEDEEEEESSEMMKVQKPGSQRYLIAIEYFGTKFSGSQQQPKARFRTVVGVLEEAFRKFIGQPVSIFCSSRTDTGVHALSNVCHVDVERISKRKPGEVLPPYEPEVVRKAVNHFLHKHEGDILVTDVRSVPSTYHARYKAQERTYFYRLLSGPEPLSIFEKDRAWHASEEDLNLYAMQKACKILMGTHDFTSFRGSGCQAKSPIRTLDELNISEVVSTPQFPSFIEREQPDISKQDTAICSILSETEPLTKNSTSNQQGSNAFSQQFGFGQRKVHRCYVVTTRSRAYLYHQVRLIVGVLKAVGTGEITIDDVEMILNAKSVLATSPMAPACGLYLANVKYELP